MQKKLLAVAVLSAFSGVAAAQSANVTLYGTLQNELQMRSADRADGSAQPVAGQESTFRTTASYVNATGTGTTLTTPQNFSSRMASQSAGSNFGVRGTEDLGNGLSAFFQIELATTIGGPNAYTSASGGTVATYRNTGLGLRSNTWGSYMFGQWDVPFDTIGNNTINGATSGPTTNVIYTLLGGNAAASGSVSGQTFDQMCNAGGSAVASSAAGVTPGFVSVASAAGGNNTVASPLSFCLNHGMNFSARRSGQLQWWSPNWNGFEVRVGYQPAQFTQNGTNGAMSSASSVLNNASGVAGAANSLTSLKPTSWDLAASYTNGGLKVVAAYQTKKDFVAQAVRTYYNSGAVFTTTGIGGGAATNGNAARGVVGFSQDISGSKDRGWRLGVSYKFDMGLTLGALYENLKWDMSYNTVSNNVAGNAVNVTQLKNNAWRLQANYATGNHTFTGEYARKSDTSGSTDAGAANQVAAFNGTSSGAKEYILGYAYSFSKRTSMLGYYMAINNDANAAYGPTFGGISGARGNKAQYYGVGLRHAF